MNHAVAASPAARLVAVDSRADQETATLTRDDALTLVRELQEFVPGSAVPGRDARLARMFEADATADVHRKGVPACYFVGVWLASDPWQLPGADPRRLRSTVLSNIDGLRRAIEDALPAAWRRGIQ